MGSKADVERILAQAEKADSTIVNLREQIKIVREAPVQQTALQLARCEEKLRKENEKLKEEIHSLSNDLAIAKIMNRVRPVRESTKRGAISYFQKLRAKTDSKENNGRASDETDDAIDASCLDIRIGRILSVKRHPNAYKLTVEQVDLGEGEYRTVCSGLLEHDIPMSAMRDFLGVFLCNIKPARLRGIVSQGLVLVAITPEKTELLEPPPGAKIGDRVVIEDYPGVPHEQLSEKKKIWKTIKTDLRTCKDHVARYKGSPFIIKGKGVVSVPTVANAQIA